MCVCSCSVRARTDRTPARRLFCGRASDKLPPAARYLSPSMSKEYAELEGTPMCVLSAYCYIYYVFSCCCCFELRC